ncbi:MAG: DUF285 domain-containing protein [archaeon]|nr:DUF285 domain-containing protein [archaeon]
MDLINDNTYDDSSSDREDLPKDLNPSKYFFYCPNCEKRFPRIKMNLEDYTVNIQCECYSKDAEVTSLNKDANIMELSHYKSYTISIDLFYLELKKQKYSLRRIKKILTNYRTCCCCLKEIKYYCMDCKKHLCEECAEKCRKIKGNKGTQGHSLMDLSTALDASKMSDIEKKINILGRKIVLKHRVDLDDLEEEYNREMTDLNENKKKGILVVAIYKMLLYFCRFIREEGKFNFETIQNVLSNLDILKGNKYIKTFQTMKEQQQSSKKEKGPKEFKEKEKESKEFKEEQSKKKKNFFKSVGSYFYNSFFSLFCIYIISPKYINKVNQHNTYQYNYANCSFNDQNKPSVSYSKCFTESLIYYGTPKTNKVKLKEDNSNNKKEKTKEKETEEEKEKSPFIKYIPYFILLLGIFLYYIYYYFFSNQAIIIKTIYLKKEELEKEIQILHPEFFGMHENNTEMYVDRRRVHFNKKHRFISEGHHTIHYIFKHNIHSFYKIFYGSTYLQEIYFSRNFRSSQIEVMEKAFTNCKNLKKLNLNSFTFKNTFAFRDMLCGCSETMDMSMTHNAYKFIISQRQTEHSCLDDYNPLIQTIIIKVSKYMFIPENKSPSKNSSDCESEISPSKEKIFLNEEIFKKCSSDFKICPKNSTSVSPSVNQTKTKRKGMKKVKVKIISSEYHELNVANTKMLVNNKEVPFSKIITLPMEVISQNSEGNLKENAFHIIKLKFEHPLTSMSKMFFNCTKLVHISIRKINTENIVDMSRMFLNCHNLRKVEFHDTNTKKVKNISHMFEKCFHLTSLDLSELNTQSVSDMSKMFLECHSLTYLDLTNFSAEKVMNLAFMFESCTKLKTIKFSKRFYTKNVVSMVKMFSNCTSLTSIDLSMFNTEKVKTMQSLFSGCTSLISLDLSNFYTPELVVMEGMFANCRSLLSVDLSNFYTKKVKTMNELFLNCSNITALHLTNFCSMSLLNMTAMIQGCTNLLYININPSEFQVSGFYNGYIPNMRHAIRVAHIHQVSGEDGAEIYLSRGMN